MRGCKCTPTCPRAKLESTSWSYLGASVRADGKSAAPLTTEGHGASLGTHTSSISSRGQPEKEAGERGAVEVQVSLCLQADFPGLVSCMPCLLTGDSDVGREVRKQSQGAGTSAGPMEADAYLRAGDTKCCPSLPDSPPPTGSGDCALVCARVFESVRAYVSESVM